MMGFPFLHKHILNDEVIFPISDISRLENIKRINAIYFDCTGLLYNLSFSIPKRIILNKPSILLLFLKNAIISYIQTILSFPCLQNEPITVYLFFDGKSPCQKRVLQFKRDESSRRRSANCIKKNKLATGLCSIESRRKRNDIIFNVAENIEAEILGYDIVRLCKTSKPDEDGESDIKIVKTIILNKHNENHFPVIVTCDSDIIISLELFRRCINNVLVLLKFPFIGNHCIFTPDLNLWLEKNCIQYKFVLFYFMFFFGCDYEVPIASATKKQILHVFNFVGKNNYKLSTKLLLQCWMELGIRPSKYVTITNLTLPTICKIIKLKRESVLNGLLYYIHGIEFPKNHVTMLPVFQNWKSLLKNINVNKISF